MSHFLNTHLYNRCPPNAQIYQVVTAPCDLALDLDEVLNHLNNSVPNEDQDYVTQLIRACSRFAINQTNLVFIDTAYRLYIDNFNDVYIELRRRPNVAIADIQYFKDGVLITVDNTIFHLTFADPKHYPTVQPLPDKEWPDDLDIRKQAVQINFTAGYGTDFSKVPDDLRLALFNHIADAYSNRGDCEAVKCGGCLPTKSALIYQQYSIIKLVA